MTDYILASGSPRRQDLLRQINIPFRVVVSNADETVEPELTMGELVKKLSCNKGQAVLDMLMDNDDLSNNTVIISADTIVVHNNKVLGKPTDKQDAINMLALLSGNDHRVYTGVTIIRYNNAHITFESFYDYATVYFRELTHDEIVEYVNTGEPMDKAGGYGIQEQGAILVEKIEGDFYTIVGLPLVKVYQALKYNI